MYKIFIDAGHGGNDPGAVNEFTQEKIINLNVSLKLSELLIFNGFDVKMSRDMDIPVSLENRSKKANEWQANLFLSIHHNASANGLAQGYQLIHGMNSLQGKLFSGILEEEFKKIGQVKNAVYSRSLRSNQNVDYYSVIRNSNMTTIITEFAFLDNVEDYKKINTIEKQHQEAEAVAKAVCSYYNLVYTPIGGHKTFTDINKCSDWARESIESLYLLGIFKGDEHGKFNPRKICDRETLAVVIDRVLKYIKNNK